MSAHNMIFFSSRVPPGGAVVAPLVQATMATGLVPTQL